MREQKLNKKEKQYLEQIPPFGDLVESKELKHEILKGIACGGAIAVMMMAPNAGIMFKWFKELNAQKRQRIKKITDSLQSRKLVERKGQYSYVLTDKGRLYLKRLELERFGFERPNDKWDGNFFLVMFDLPRGHDYARMTFKRTLKKAGFVIVQSSVYVHPYNHEKSCKKLAEICDIQDYVSYCLCTNLIHGDKQAIIDYWRELKII